MLLMRTASYSSAFRNHHFSRISRHGVIYSNYDRRHMNNNSQEQPATIKQKLKKAVAEYGSTVIVFHVSISLISLGTCYLLVSSGVNVTEYMQYLGVNDDKIGKLAGNAGTFAIAYAVHKVFAPVRIGITLTATPIIVQYLRRAGILKHK